MQGNEIVPYISGPGGSKCLARLHSTNLLSILAAFSLLVSSYYISPSKQMPGSCLSLNSPILFASFYILG